jgi:hypothetical protein
MTNPDAIAARMLDEETGFVPLDQCALGTLGDLRRALLVALEDVETAITPKLVEYRATGTSLQRLAELAGMSILTVRKAVVPGAAEKNREWQSRSRKGAGQQPTRVVVTDDATETFAANGPSFA